MHWLVLMFWEYHKALSVPFVNRIFFWHEKERQARLHLLLGIMYSVCTEQYPVCEDFFWNLAVAHFRQATENTTDWIVPYLYLANIYSIAMLSVQGKKREEFFKEAAHLYEEVINCTERIERKLWLRNDLPLLGPVLRLAHPESKNELLQDHYKIIVLKTVIELTYYDAQSIDTNSVELEQRLSQLEIEEVKLSQPDITSVYNLAYLYMLARERGLNIQNVRKKAQRLVEDNLGRFPELVGLMKEEPLFGSLDLATLEKKLEDKRKMNPKLTTLQGEGFRTEIDTLLEK